MTESNLPKEVQRPTGMSQGAQMRITEQERELIQRTFKDNEPLLLLLRKMFLPEIDPTAPLGQIVDLWMTVNVKDMTPEQAYVNLLARNALITHVDQQLMSLYLISKAVTPTSEEVIAKVKADSAK